jgi:hypothetical protein
MINQLLGTIADRRLTFDVGVGGEASRPRLERSRHDKTPRFDRLRPAKSGLLQSPQSLILVSAQ